MKRAQVAKPLAADKRRTRSQRAPAVKAKNDASKSSKRKPKPLTQVKTPPKPIQNAQRIVSDDENDLEISRQGQSDADLTLKLDLSDEYDDGNVTVLYKQASCSQTSPYFNKKDPKRSAATDEIDFNLESSDEEWEEVEIAEEEEEKQVVIPKEGVEITIDPGDLIKRKRNKKEFDWNNYARLCLNRFRKDLQQDLHKVHVMCLLSHGMFVNSEINSDLIQGLVMSIIPSRFFKLKPKKMTLTELHDFVSWFHGEFRLDLTLAKRESDFRTCLIDQVSCRTVNRSLDCAAIMIAALRLLGFDARLILSMQPISVKAVDLIKPKPVREDGDEAKMKPDANLNDGTQKIGKKSVGRPPSVAKTTEKTQNEVGDAKKTRKSVGKLKSPAKKDEKSEDSDDGAKKTRKSVGKPRSVAKTAEKAQNEVGDAIKTRKSVRKLKSPAIKVEKSEDSDDGAKKTKKSVGNQSSALNKDGDDGDSDFEITTRKRKTPARKRLRTTTDADGDSRARKKAKSEEEEEDREENEPDNDYWAEVYLEKKSQWICIDSLYGRVDCESEIEARTKRPFIYIVSFDNRNKMKDMTSHYATNWLTINRKLRCDPDWWTELLEPFRPRLTVREKRENAAIEDELMKKPLPKTIGEFKGHPLYALTRHLLKFEALYPPEPAPVGFIRGEAIYSRDCVHTLHSRETWLKEAKTIMVGEKPYKIVKARPKWNKNMGMVESDLPCEIFGAWQTRDYDPPIASNGKVPRNEYGNVDMFKECMLPVGTVHLRVPRLLRVARKLGIDCVPAMTGWDFLKSGNKPIFDGWIVCAEFEEVLMEAWRQQMKLDFDRQGEKREKRVYGNWRRLIRAVFIRERLNTKYFKLSDK